jgi:hypothetical protein
MIDPWILEDRNEAGPHEPPAQAVSAPSAADELRRALWNILAWDIDDLIPGILTSTGKRAIDAYDRAIGREGR